MPFVRSLFTTAALALLTAILPACSSTDAPDRADMRDTRNALLQHDSMGGALPLVWTNKYVPYCFVPPSTNGQGNAVFAERRAQFNKAIADSWGSEGSVRFEETICSAQTVYVRFADLPQGVAGQANIGPGAAGTKATVGLRLASYYLQDTNLRDFPWVVAHEMGHVLGFDHEQNQATSTCPMGRDTSGAEGVALTSYDPQSVMNYCAQRNNNDLLSDLDRQGFRKVYGQGNPNPPSPPGPTPPPSPSPGPVDNPPSTTTGTAPNNDPCNPTANQAPSVPASSREPSDAVTFSVINRCPQASLRVLWLDFEGQEREYRVLGPGQEAQFITYPNHSWLFRHAQSNRLVGNLIAPASPFMATLP